jgi:hypothetical protein
VSSAWMQGHPDWTPPHNEGHYENWDCRPGTTPQDDWCTPAVEPAKHAAYDPPPNHYQGDGTIQPWDVWDAFDLDRYTANAVKYLLRAGKKDIAPRLDDLKKAANYIAKAIEMEEKRDG